MSSLPVVKPGVGAASLLFAITIAGCGTPVSSPSPSAGASADQSPDPVALSTPPALTENDQPLTCGSPLTFGAEALLGGLGAETADHPAAEALRSLLAWDNVLPTRDGWRIVVLSEDDAVFLLPATPDEGSTFWNASFHRADSSWVYVRSGQCDAKPWFEGIEVAYWELAPGEQPGPDSRTLRVLVYEQACASGNSPEGRIVRAAVTYLEDSVIVILGTKPLPGPQMCGGPHPPAEFSVELREPLGDRQLLDGCVLPPEPRGSLQPPDPGRPSC